ncbi:nucleoside triphosphate pyrophosphohydrolase [Halalkalibacillus halophilus]|uniref:nucleoside triphosphate pyrophosphohydrolase n=1 Tax=Halalkalibacillus halophilus TaxID=392827 RepID=UPI0003F5A9BB|nr:nucleoside triphosphate pyrophosphohydrolase [Halalkalibacillus halophilus]
MSTIRVIGLGTSTIDQLPLGVYKEITRIDGPVYTRTLYHPVVQSLQSEGVIFQSFDEVYEENEAFGSVYETIAERLIKEAESGDVLYTVPGHPMVAERTVQLLLEQKTNEMKVEIAGGQSFLDAMFTALEIDPIEGFQLVDGTALQQESLHLKSHILIGQVYDQMVASDVKLTLLEELPHDHPVTIVDAAGSEKENIQTVALHEIDHDFSFSNLATLYVAPVEDELLHHHFGVLREVIATLRGPNGCPWDRKQTHETLRKYLIEEAYEVIEAIEAGDDDHLADELGDLLLQVMLHSQIAEGDGFFTVDDVIRNITDKMIERHPHVFAEVNVETSEDVVTNWEAIKQQGKPKQDSVLNDRNRSLPRLLYAEEIQKKVAKVGFDWKEEASTVEKLEEEIKEFQEAVANLSKEEMEKEYGDILFTAVNIARHYKINPEIALNRTCETFVKRFQLVEQAFLEREDQLEEASLEELERVWQTIKEQVK